MSAVPLRAVGSHHLLAQLSEISAGRVRLCFAPDVVDALVGLESVCGSEPDPPLLALSWPQDTDTNGAIKHVVTSLAGVALARWPDWYDEHAPFAQPDLGASMLSEYDGRVINRLGETRSTLDPAWTRQAVQHCRRGIRPVLDGFSHPVQMKQLILAAAQDNLVLLMALESREAHTTELLCFARAAAWIAGETRVRVAAIVPSEFREAAALDAISYGAVLLEDRPEQGMARASRSPSRAEGRSNTGNQARLPGGEVRRSTSRRPKDEPSRLVLPPIIGGPHPASPGEQLLARWLARDAELAPLFAFNQRVDTTGGDSFVVDLLWHSGKIVVEVDGYRWHSSPHAFSSDRDRDYRLLCDGYRTLRLPHDEVMDDPALQCEKIRDVVRMIQKEVHPV